ncbi:PAR3L protein, partial [Atractosteus spatula]|nr:PAR3L protein [Atractosteus spatula]
MKVTVNFGKTGVVVPCKDGWTVRDLIQQATQRYMKLLEQDGSCFVKIHHLEYSDGGILDPDDILADLVDDKDKLIALYEEQEAQREAGSPHVSVSGRPSPDPYENELAAQLSVFQPVSGEIEVNSSALKSNTPLMVRSSSDPALSPPMEGNAGVTQSEDTSVHFGTETNHVVSEKGSSDLLRRADVLATKMNQITLRYSRQDLEFHKPALEILLEGGAVSPRVCNTRGLGDLTRTVEISGDDGPLGIHVVPYCSSLSGRTLGLYIRGVEENSRSKREGIFHEDECIVKINDIELMDKSFSQSQETFRQAMRYATVRLEVVPSHNRERYEKKLIGQLFSSDPAEGVPKGNLPAALKGKMASKASEPAARHGELSVKPAEPAAKPSEAHFHQHQDTGPAPTPPGTSLTPVAKSKSDSPLLKKSPAISPLVAFGNKKMGKKLKIDLKKGPEGLGFTVVTRDSSVHGPGPILVKNILPRGAAIKDGRLQSGDRILEVNGMDITGKTQEELVGMLRSTKQGETVSLVVARQEEVFLPRELAPMVLWVAEPPARSCAACDVLLKSRGSEAGRARLLFLQFKKGEQDWAIPALESKEQLMFEIPLNDSGSAGLGVSLKGNKSRETGADLGIFIKSIIHGGAAFKDGRLRANDQLIAVNGESLLGKSNHDAMETLRRSMSMEGNIRGMIQLVVARSLDRPNEVLGLTVQPDQGQTQAEHSADKMGCGQSSMIMFLNCRSGVVETLHILYLAPNQVMNGGYNTEEEERDEDRPSPPIHLDADASKAAGSQSAPFKHLYCSPALFHFLIVFLPCYSPEWQMSPNLQGESEHRNVKSSKSMDLVADESNVGSLAGTQSGPPRGGDLGPTLGLKKSSSLESLQTAMSEVKKNELPFHRPRPHMVRGRGCNESFRAAIDKSYDGPPEADDDELSDQSSGRDTPASGSSRQGNPDNADESKKDKKKKAKEKKKDKAKTKGKEKDRKRLEDIEEQDKKSKKKGFGAMLRFGKKKEEKGKTALQKQKSEMLSEEELEKMKEERERIEAKHHELREKQARERFEALPDVEDDDADPNYARINHFREMPPGQGVNRNRTPSPQTPPVPVSHGREAPPEEALEGLYAKVNKQRPQQQPPPDSTVDRIQQLRKEYQQARREGAAPAYEELEARRRPPEFDPHRIPRGHDARLAIPRYEDVERQYASLPRRGPMEPNEYPLPPWAGQGEREPLRYPGAQPMYPPYTSRGNYPRPSEPRQGEPSYYPPPPQQRGPLRQDVPPSPPMPLRSQRYDTMTRTGYRTASPEGYGYGDGRRQDPRQKNAMTAAV